MGVMTDYMLVKNQLPVREWVPTILQIRKYAEASGDFNPIHLDEEYAKQAGLGGVIAHGMLTMAQLTAMLTDWLGGKGEVVYLKVRFEGMVRPGELIRFTGSIISQEDKNLECELIAIKEKDTRILSGRASVKLF
ncbi:MAG: acyl dehydratase [Desulfitobacterium sp.]|nr:acyl dehydratase [Desulfitobacterium sp.]